MDNEKQADRCIRNERKIDSLSNKIEIINDAQLRQDIKIDSVNASLNRLILNDLHHKAEKGSVLLTRSKRDVGIAIAVIGGIATIISTIISNLDVILRWLLGG